MSSPTHTMRSRRIAWISLAAVAMVVMAACHKVNDLYCEGHPLDPSCMDAMTRSCSSNAQCAAPTAVCKVSAMTCVQCTGAEASACTGVTPVCGADNACRRCETHADCPSSACLPNGSCGSDDVVAYVDAAGTDNTMCTKAMPCTKLAAALATGRAYVKFHGTTDEAVSIAGGRQVTFLADAGAKLTRTNGVGAIITVQDSGTSLAVYDLSISNAPNNPSGVGLVISAAGGPPAVSLTRVTIANNPGGGISASGGTLTVTQSTLKGNTGGGINVGSGAVFVIVGNVFFNNGSSASTIGGVTILTTQSAMNRLEFNTFNKNQTQDTIGSAIQCTAGTFEARNNIMSGNGTLSNTEQTGGSCTHAYSIALPGTLPPGGTNIARDPLFKDTITGDLHIQPGSPAIRAAAPGSDLTGIAAHDIDGDARISPADLGADEAPR